MKIEGLFERDIFRSINGVVKADQLDESSVWQELDEFVVTRELDQHLRKFFSAYGDALQKSHDPAVAGNIGVWVSGFFGSGKSHFIKVLSYLLRNRTHTHQGQSKLAVEFFESKIKDAMLFGDIKRAVASHADVILFNIDSKADPKKGRDALLAVFLKVLNEMQGYCGDHPHIAHLERYLESRGQLEQFNTAFRKATDSDWTKERDAYQFHRDAVVEALVSTLGMSQESAEKWVDGAEGSFALTIENFCKWVKDYLDAKGPDHRLLFLVDEVGQFIGTDSHLMLNLQTITEDLGTICQGRAWIIVTSQEDIDSVVGEMKKSKANDFSKIQGRFKTRLSLSSTNVDEVIQSRLLAKREEVEDDLKALFQQKGDILKHQLTFVNCGMTFRNFRNEDDFVKNYPFAPYQFQLVQKVFEAIRNAGATGLHLSRGERSVLDAFQTAGKKVALKQEGILVPLYEFYPAIESFLDTAVKKTIDQARDNPGLELPFDIELLQVLFLIRYVEEMKGNVDNLVTLCLDEIDADRLALRRKVEASLARLEKQTLIRLTGDVYTFLTNEERDIDQDIKHQELNNGDDTRLLGELIFNDVLKEQHKYRYPVNKMDFKFNRLCDLYPIGSRADWALLVAVISPLNDDYALFDKGKCLLTSSAEGGHVLMRLGNDARLEKELLAYLKTEKYVRRKMDGTLPEPTRKILRGIADDNQARRGRLVTILGEMLAAADFYVAGEPLKLKAATPLAALDEALEYLVRNTFTKMGYLKQLSPDPLPEIQAILRSNDVAQQALALQVDEGNKQAIDDVRNYVGLMAASSKQLVLHEMIEKRYSLRPYGWPDDEVLLLLARLLVLGEVSLMMDGALLSLDKVYEAITAPVKRRKIVVIKRQTSDPKSIQNARALGKELFHEMGPDGEDPLFGFLQIKFKGWQSALASYQPLAATGNYPGQHEIEGALAPVKKLLACDASFQFIEQFNSQKTELLDLIDNYRDLEHFYEHQKPTWEKLRKAFDKFQLNRLELERDAQAGPALARMHGILAAPSPYGLIKDAEGLISAVNIVNLALVTNRRQQATAKIDEHILVLSKDIQTARADGALSTACLKPLELLGGRVRIDESLAHITQAEAEALKEFDSAIGQIEEFVHSAAAKAVDRGAVGPPPTLKPKRVIQPANLVGSPGLETQYLETQADVDRFLDRLRSELEKAVNAGHRIEIR